LNTSHNLPRIPVQQSNLYNHQYGIGYNINQIQTNNSNMNNQFNFPNNQYPYGNNYNANYSGGVNQNYSGHNMSDYSMRMQQGQYDLQNQTRNFLPNYVDAYNFEKVDNRNHYESHLEAGNRQANPLQSYKSYKENYQTSNSNSSVLNIINKQSATPHNPSSTARSLQHSNSSSNLNTVNINSRKHKTSLFNNNQETDDTMSSLTDLLSSLETDLHQFITTQKGSRTMQKFLDRINPQVLDIILERLKDNFAFIMTDLYGNYFCQRLIQSCSSEQRIFMLVNMKHDIITISMNSCGTHSLQSLIEIINLKEEGTIILESIKRSLLKLSLDVNATHVIQKLILCLDENNRVDMSEEILSIFNKLIGDSNGVCVLKKFINKNKSDEIRKNFIEKIAMNILETVQNPFGNYVIQYVLDEWEIEDTKDIIAPIIKNAVSLSMQKFSSNVVEKCLQMGDSVLYNI